MRQCNYKPCHTTLQCARRQQRSSFSRRQMTLEARERACSGLHQVLIVFWQLMYSAVHRGRESGRREREDRGREIRKTNQMYQSSAIFFEGYLFKDSSFFLSHSWMVHQCRALNKQIPHFRMKWWLSHKSLRILICIRLQSTACTLALWDL